MATIVLQAVGAAVGGIFGPVGAAIGAGLGAMGGYAIDTAIINSTRHMEGHASMVVVWQQQKKVQRFLSFMAQRGFQAR